MIGYGKVATAVADPVSGDSFALETAEYRSLASRAKGLT